MPLLFALTLFLSASLLFLVQPMVGRMLLPSLGGSPAVWNTCLVFFQAILLLGYLYAHISTRLLGVRRQVIVHLLVLGLPLLLLPITLDRSRIPDAEAPAWWLLITLCMVVGVPFFVVSTTGPLLQKWFTATGHRSANDPYYLYVASNLGSLLALIAYPLVLEFWLPLTRQSEFWHWGYLGFVGMCSLCGLIVLCSRPSMNTIASPENGVKPRTALRWVGLAFIPSSLLMGVTAHLTTNLAPIPLLWVVPLALYLLTFVVAFSKSYRLSLKWTGKLLAISVIAATMVMLLGATEPLYAIIPIHLLMLFLAGLLCHGILASERPPTGQLTAFYLWLSVGGVLGGVFNALLAPLIFHKVGDMEYPLMLVVVSVLVSAWDGRMKFTDWFFPLLVGLLASGFVIAVEQHPASADR